MARYKKYRKAMYMYIISNPAFPGWYKIGRSNNVFRRLESYQTADPNRKYKIEFYLEVKDCLIHEYYFKRYSKNEWTNLSLDNCIKIIENIENCNFCFNLD